MQQYNDYFNMFKQALHFLRLLHQQLRLWISVIKGNAFV